MSIGKNWCFLHAKQRSQSYVSRKQMNGWGPLTAHFSVPWMAATIPVHQQCLRSKWLSVPRWSCLRHSNPVVTRAVSFSSLCLLINIPFSIQIPPEGHKADLGHYTSSEKRKMEIILEEIIMTFSALDNDLLILMKLFLELDYLEGLSSKCQVNILKRHIQNKMMSYLDWTLYKQFSH